MHSTKETHRKLPCTPTLNQSVPLTVTENTRANGEMHPCQAITMKPKYG